MHVYSLILTMYINFNITSWMFQRTLQSSLYMQNSGQTSSSNIPDCAPIIQHKFGKNTRKYFIYLYMYCKCKCK